MFLLTLSALPFHVTAQVETPKNETPKADTLLIPIDTTLLDAVTIIAERPLFSFEGEKTLYQVSQDPTVQSGVASDALQNAPGVTVDVEGNVTLRGASSVEIWINDQPSHLSDESLKAYLQSLPASAIERIEVITNPSAKYATSADGVINIVMNTKVKRNEFLCFGSNVSSQPYVMPWASYVWKNEQWTVNAFANFHYFHNKGESHFERELFEDDEAGNTFLTCHQTGSTKSETKSYSPSFNLNITYEPDQKNVFSFYAYSWNYFGPSVLEQERERMEYIEQSGNYKYSILNKSNSRYFYLMPGLYYLHKFNEKGHNLTLQLSGNLNHVAVPIDYHKTYTLPSFYERVFVNDYANTTVPISMKADYNLPYSENGELMMGLNGSLTGIDTHCQLDSLANGIYVHDSVMSYRYRSHNRSAGGYLMVRHRFGDFTLQPGISFIGFQTDIAYPDAPAYDSAKHAFNLLPSLHLSYRTQSMHNFKMSYTMRVNHPTAEQLSPFIKFDEESYMTGNPKLEPVFTHNLEANWTKYWDDFGSIGLTGYYKAKKNEINNIVEAGYHDYYGRVVSYSIPVNVGRFHLAGGEFNMTYRPNGMFNLRFYANVYDSYIETHYGALETLGKSEMLCYSLRLNLWTKLWNRLEVHASAYYNSPTQSLFSQQGARYSVDCGMRADFFDHKLSVFVNGLDLFGLLKQETINSSPSASTSETMKYNSSCICAGFTLRFGNIELENEAQTGGEEAGK